MFDDLASDFDNEPTKEELKTVKANSDKTFLDHAAEYTGQYVEECPDCRGTGKFVSWSGRVVGDCFKCKGEGQRAFKTSSADRAKARASAAKAKAKKQVETEKQGADWLNKNHPEVSEWILDTSSWNNFAQSLFDSLMKYGKLTEGQLKAAQKSAAKHIAKKEEKEKAEEDAPQIDSAGLKPVLDAFEKATDNGLKRPKIRLDGFQLSLAPAHGKNAGHLYVKDGDTYLGKITPEGKFIKPFNLDAEIAADIDAKLKEVGDDPMDAAVAYGKRTGECSCCGRTLTDPNSIKAGIGPICESNFF